MWNCLAKCKMCLGEFEERQHTSQYRKNIVKTGATHLFDELVDWNSIRIDESLPFCSCCLETIENISSLNDNCTLFRKEVEDLADKFTMESLRNRKLVKSNSGLLPSRTTFIKLERNTNPKSNCVICYGIYFEGQPIQAMQSVQVKKNIWKVCKTYLLPAILKNECKFDWKTLPLLNYEPFCTKCSLNVHRIFDLDKKLELAEEKMRDFVDSFSLRCLKKQKTVTGSVDIENQPPNVGDIVQISDEEENFLPVDPLDLNTVTRLHQTGENDYSAGDMLPEGIFVREGFDLDTTTQEATFTGQNPNTSDSPAQDAGSSSEYMFTDNDSRDSEMQVNRRSSSVKRSPGTFQASSTLFSPQPEPSTSTNTPNTRNMSIKRKNQSGYKCSHCKKVYFFSSQLRHHQRLNKKCAPFFKNLSIGPQMPTLVDLSNNPNIQMENNSVKDNGTSTIKPNCPPRVKSSVRKHSHEVREYRKKLAQNKGNPISAVTGKLKRVFDLKCYFCFEKFRTPQELSIHYQSHYEEALDTRCEICRFVYSTEQRLKLHYKKKHQNQC